MRCLLKLHVAIDGVSACVVVMGQGTRGEGAYRTLLAYNVSPCYDMLEQCIPVFVDTPEPVFGSESDRPTL